MPPPVRARADSRTPAPPAPVRHFARARARTARWYRQGTGLARPGARGEGRQARACATAPRRGRAPRAGDDAQSRARSHRPAVTRAPSEASAPRLVLGPRNTPRAATCKGGGRVRRALGPRASASLAHRPSNARPSRIQALRSVAPPLSRTFSRARSTTSGR